jgi:hypothetical protein
MTYFPALHPHGLPAKLAFLTGTPHSIKERIHATKSQGF